MTLSTRKPFPFYDFESKWQQYWDANQSFRTPQLHDSDFDRSKPKYYVLDMFPYPSGAGLHVGHPEGYTATDIVARFKKMNGFNVLHPMGYDSFGLPAEQYAVKTGKHPAITTAANIENFRRQLKALGFSYDWNREIATTDPEYVRWTQWIFLQLYGAYFDQDENKAKPVSYLQEKGWSKEEIDAVRLAYVAETPVWWSPDLGTVLANEEVEEWKGKGHTVERRPLRQWILRITTYAQRLIDDLDLLDWPEGIKLLQKNWIGKSEGATVYFSIDGKEDRLEVYTTRPDTLFGVSYMVIAPEHPLVQVITIPEQRAAVEAYQKQCSLKSDLDRGDLNKDKSGVFTGAYAINPVNQELVPIWIADYVMMSYGSGAIMAVPGHDERDFEFAQRFGLKIKRVVAETISDESPLNEAFTQEGISVQSDFLNGLTTSEAKKVMLAWIEEQAVGRKKIQFKLRDWLFSRQRYWGEPFPIIWKDGQHEALDEAALPLLAPPLEDYKPSGTPEPLLGKAKEWVELPNGYTRETNTMPQWAGSCWYYLRYCDPKNNNRFLSQEEEDYWTSSEDQGMVDLYIGGTEHAVLHLLYARFWHKVLYDLGHLKTKEPFQKLVNQGLILGEDGQKMSKSRGNVVNPDDVIQLYGADTLRLYEMFMGPLEQVKPWQMKGLEGISRFLARVWRVVYEQQIDGSWLIIDKVKPTSAPNAELRRTLHQTILKVTHDIEQLSFNTAISQMMICTNTFTSASEISLNDFTLFLQLLNPFAPHITEELHEVLCQKFNLPHGLLSHTAWPKHDPDALLQQEMQIIVQVNGKLRDRLTLDQSIDEPEVKQMALASSKVQEHLLGKTISKVIYVPKKIVNIVAI